ncbi:hypothetical protein KEM48_012152 [Puccinia striiformis f. sp. tritici PST-130]|nr:hypothetical protein KEM48_012152 [Puccinia striiformis f. sp. tritici PST-130]
MSTYMSEYPKWGCAAKRCCKEDSSYDAQQHETSGGASGVMKLNTSLVQLHSNCSEQCAPRKRSQSRP